MEFIILYLFITIIWGGIFKITYPESTIEDSICTGLVWPVILSFYIFILLTSIISYIVECVKNTFEE